MATAMCRAADAADAGKIATMVITKGGMPVMGEV